MAKDTPLSGAAREALELLGAQIQIQRKIHGWSEEQLAERTGISRSTLRKIERGDPSCASGSLFQCATLVGVPLFEESRDKLSRRHREVLGLLPLLPKRARTVGRDIDNDF